MKTIPCYYSIIFSDRRFTFSLFLPASRAKKPLHVLNHYFNNLEIICCEFSKRQLSQYYKELYKQIGLNSLKTKTPHLLEFISFDIDLKAELIDAEYILKSLGTYYFGPSSQICHFCNEKYFRILESVNSEKRLYILCELLPKSIFQTNFRSNEGNKAEVNPQE